MKNILLFLLSVTALASGGVSENPNTPTKSVTVTVLDELGKLADGRMAKCAPP